MASQFKLKKDAAANIATPATNKQAYFVDSDDKFKKKLDTGTVVDLESGLTYTNEDAQDAVGGILLDTASVDLNYNDSAPSISATVLPAGVDHNALSNYVAAQHVNHTSVNIATAATSGLQGGGDISATRNLSLNINGLTEETAVTVDDEIAIYDSSAAAHRKIKAFRSNPCNPNRWFSKVEDFVETINGGLLATALGTGASTQAGTYGIDLTENCQGVTQIDTGTTATGRVSLNTTSTTQLISGAGQLRWTSRFAPELLSTGIETFTLYAGFLDNAGAGDQVDGCYFRYTDAVNSGRWEAVVAAASVRIAIDTGISPTISYQTFQVRINAAGTEATFFIDGALVATHSTGVPNGQTELFGYGWKIEKSVGILQRNLSIDWVCYEYERSTER